MMVTFTTRQREILKILLDVKRPIGSVELAKLLHLTPRQVNYSMKEVRVWLKQHGKELTVLPGVGFAMDLNADQLRSLSQKINIHSEVQIVLSLSQRQQLLALFLLIRTEPCILAQLEQISYVSRMTILKDLDEVEKWLGSQNIMLIRKPHFGIQVSGAEHDCQQALAELLWGETALSSDPVTKITHSEGLNFNLQGDAQLLPLVGNINRYLSSLPMRRAISLVAKAEEQLGGRFTDDAVLHLALIFAILANRIEIGKHLKVEDRPLDSLQSTKMWQIAGYVAGKLGHETNSIWKPGAWSRKDRRGALAGTQQRDPPSRYFSARDQAGWDYADRQESGKSTQYEKVRFRMPFEQHKEKSYAKDAQSVFDAALKATQKLEGRIISSVPEGHRFTARFPKVILGQTLGERTELVCEVRPNGDGGMVIVDAFPLDAVERKLMFGARKGVTQTVVTWFIAHLENNLGLPPA